MDKIEATKIIANYEGVFNITVSDDISYTIIYDKALGHIESPFFYDRSLDALVKIWNKIMCEPTFNKYDDHWKCTLTALNMYNNPLFTSVPVSAGKGTTIYESACIATGVMIKQLQESHIIK